MGDSFTPTKAMRVEAQRGLDWRDEYGRGGTAVGIARARDIVNGKDLPIETVTRMHSFFARHEIDKKGQGFTPGDDGYPSNGRIAWSLWGGDAGQRWAASIVAADERKETPPMPRDLVNLPAEVLDRLPVESRADLTIDVADGKRGRATVEQRFHPMELRTDDTGTPHLVGYAMTWGVPYDIAGGPDVGGFTETIERGAADKSLAERDSVVFLFDHEGIPLASTKAGTLTLRSDDVGLLYDATLDPASPYAQSVISAVKRGDVTGSSHAMRIIRQEWADNYSKRSIREIAMYDVSAVTRPANPVTAVAFDQRALDPAAEAAEEDLAGQIRELVARLIAGEAAELQSGSPAVESLRALVGVLCALDWWEEIDEAEDAYGAAESTDPADEAIETEEPGEDEMPARSLPLATARAIADAVGARA